VLGTVKARTPQGVGSQAREAGTDNQITLGENSLAYVIASNNTATVGNSSRDSVTSDNAAPHRNRRCNRDRQ